MTKVFTNEESTRREFYKVDSGHSKYMGGRGVFVCLMTFSHKSFAQDVLFVNNTERVISRGKTFEATAITLTLPADDGKREPQCDLDVDNVSLELVEDLRTVTDPIDVKFEMVFTEYPDIVEYSLLDLKMVSVSVTSNKVSAKLMLNDLLNMNFPSFTYNPVDFAGLF